VIDRERLVRRHNVVVTQWHPSSTLSVGNGDFAVNVDITGLQTFPREHELLPRPQLVTDDQGVRRLPRRAFHRDDFPVPLRTQSTWGWYRTDPGRRFTLAEASTPYRTRRGTVRYPDAQRFDPNGVITQDAGGWLYANPRRLDLGRVGLRFPGGAVTLADIEDGRIELDLWTGCVHARFRVLDQPVEVWTVAHPDKAVVATRVVSPLLAAGRLAVAVNFPGQSDPLAGFEWLVDTTSYTRTGPVHHAHRTVGDTDYVVTVAAVGTGTVGDDLVVTSSGPELTATVEFGPVAAGEPPGFPDVRAAAAAHWAAFWGSGAAVSFEGSADPRAGELERRVVLSQYLTAVHCAGVNPPQESGLVHNSWGGKFHLEMHWWHAAHFVPWRRPALLERSLDWYRRILPVARDTARGQGYRGARWPKQVGPDGRESPSQVGVFLVWQQPHPVYYAELLWLLDRDRAVLDRYREIVFATADFMADFPERGDEGRLHLGPPVVPAQETYYPDRARTADPTFELTYWYWALTVAQQWRTRLGFDREPRWDAALRDLAAPPIRDGMYAAVATEPYTLPDDHPSMLMALGFLPRTPLIEDTVMAATLDDVLTNWDLDSTWGWDYPVLAMCATRLGRPAAALDALLMPAYKNHYLPSGHVPQFPGGLSVYLPANGGLLAAVAMMVAGWHGSGQSLPGFPDDGSWQVSHEGFGRYPPDLPTS
jgi:hypothetical protein